MRVFTVQGSFWPFLTIFFNVIRFSLEDRLMDCYVESNEGAPKDKVGLFVFFFCIVSSSPSFS